MNKTVQKLKRRKRMKFVGKKEINTEQNNQMRLQKMGIITNKSKCIMI